VSPSTPPPTPARPRRALRIATPVLALAAALTALPAAANVPEGWSEPDAVSGVQFLLVLILLPVGLVLVVGLVYLAPGFARGEGFTGRDAHADDQWFGGPDRDARELPASEEERPAITGGAGGRW
jgi:hypothetical protein